MDPAAEKRIIRTHEDAALGAMRACRPKTFAHWRIHALVAIILDTGCRIEELRTANVTAFDFDNLLVTVNGKGRKERRVRAVTSERFVTALSVLGLLAGLGLIVGGGLWLSVAVARGDDPDDDSDA